MYICIYIVSRDRRREDERGFFMLVVVGAITYLVIDVLIVFVPSILNFGF